MVLSLSKLIDSSPMKFQSMITPASLRYLRPLSIWIKAYNPHALQGAGYSWRKIVPTPSSTTLWLLLERKTVGLFFSVAETKPAVKWVKYEKVTVFSRPLLILNGSPWPKWGWMFAVEDSLVWAAASRQVEGKNKGRGKRRAELSFEGGLALGWLVGVWQIRRIQLLELFSVCRLGWGQGSVLTVRIYQQAAEPVTNPLIIALSDFSFSSYFWQGWDFSMKRIFFFRLMLSKAKARALCLCGADF